MEKIKFTKKRILLGGVVIVAAIILMGSVFGPSVIKNIDVEDMALATDQKSQLMLSIEPKDANIDDLNCQVKDESIASITKLNVSGLKEGTTTLTCRLGSKESTANIVVTKSEEQKKKEAETAKAAQEKADREKAEKERAEKEKVEKEKAAQEKAAQEAEQERVAKEQEAAQQEVQAVQEQQTSPQTSQPNEQTVYLSRTGTKYHYNQNCSNMKNPTTATLSQAINSGREPCSNCAR